MARPLLIKNVTLIDGTGALPVDGASVLIEDGAVVAAGRDVRADGADEIDGSGRWAAPGLIDTHVHLELVGVESLRLFLALGLTTVRDLGGALDVLVQARKDLEAGAAGSRLLYTGPMIDGDPPTWPALNRATSSPEEAVRAVEEHLAAGADAIKLYTTLTPESLRRCIEHVDGRVPVTGHLGRTLSSEAMEAGINGLEHALLTPYNDFVSEDKRTGHAEGMVTPGFWPKVMAGWQEVDLESERSKRWIALLVEKDVSFCPTLTLAPGAGARAIEDELRYSRTVAGRWLEATQQREAIVAPPEFQLFAQKTRTKLQELVARVHDAGGRVVSGTDTGAIRSLVPGFALHHELEYLSGAGLSNMDVLRCATARAAEALGRDDLGTIEPGKRADVLLLRRNPLDDISALHDIERVVADGRVFEPEALLAGLAADAKN
ncbi:MAG: amidohydrolase family protein [Dehalococcoidia bacterium]